MQSYSSVAKPWKQALAVARFIIRNRFPYLYPGVLELRAIESSEVKTLTADKWWRLYVNPIWIVAEKPEVVAGELLHVLWHLLRDHHTRATSAGMEPELATLAGDLEINDSLQELISLPEGSPLPKDFHLPKGETMEVYYQGLLQFQSSEAKSQSQTGDGNKPEEGTKSDCGSPADEDSSSLRSNRCCGSCADGAVKPQEINASEKSESAVAEHQATMIKHAIARAIREASPDAQGSMPAAFKRFANEELDSQVPWQSVLRDKVARSAEMMRGQVDYTFSRPSRRHVSGSLRLPSMVAPKLRLAFVVDTSGSMQGNDFAQALVEVRSAISAIGMSDPVQVICTDSASSPVQKIFDPSEIELIGGGGTDMGKGIAAALQLFPLPSVIIVLTDGETPWPSKPLSAIAVVAVLLRKAIQPPSWIETVQLGERKQKW